MEDRNKEFLNEKLSQTMLNSKYVQTYALLNNLDCFEQDRAVTVVETVEVSSIASMPKINEKDSVIKLSQLHKFSLRCDIVLSLLAIALTLGYAMVIFFNSKYSATTLRYNFYNLLYLELEIKFVIVAVAMFSLVTMCVSIYGTTKAIANLSNRKPYKPWFIKLTIIIFSLIMFLTNLLLMSTDTLKTNGTAMKYLGVIAAVILVLNVISGYCIVVYGYTDQNS